MELVDIEEDLPFSLGRPPDTTRELSEVSQTMRNPLGCAEWPSGNSTTTSESYWRPEIYTGSSRSAR